MDGKTILLAEQDYPLLNLFWTMLWLFLWILWIFLLIRILSDVFRSADMSGWAKAAWCIFVILLPFLGVLMYIVFRGSKMHERDMQQAQAADAAFRSYVQQAATPGAGTADELTKLAALRDAGTITDAEFQSQKAKLLA